MRRVFTLCSVVVHAVVIAAALIAQVLAVGTLPTPRRPVTFDGVHIIRVTDVPSRRCGNGCSRQRSSTTCPCRSS